MSESLQTKRKDKICNICLKDKALTNENLSWDHVPPKGGIDLSTMKARRYDVDISVDRTIIQNGLKFRTLCSDCNSKLGSFYDIAFNSFLIDVKKYLLSKIVQFPYVESYPTLLIKGLLAHILATKTQECCSKIDQETRKFIFNSEAILSPDIHVYYWLFPFNCTIIREEEMYFNPYSGEKLHITMLKTFPIAFAVTYKSVLSYPHVIELTKLNQNDEEQKSKLIIPKQLYALDFPESLVREMPRLVKSEPSNIFASPKN